MAAKADQANDHHDEQYEVRYQRSDVGHFGDLQVEWDACDIIGSILSCANLLKTYMSAERQKH